MKQWDKYALVYDEITKETGGLVHQKLTNPEILQFFGNVSGKVILDAGCGNGYWSRKLSAFAKQVIGVDSSKKLIEIAKKRGKPSNVIFKTADLAKTLPFEDNYFDIIVSNMVLHFLPNIRPVAKEFKRILKGGGKLIFSICHPKCEMFKYKKLRIAKRRTKYNIKALEEKAELTEYYESLDGYKKTFENTGFELIGLKEPLITRELIRQYPHYKKFKDLPRVAVFNWEKKK